MNQKSKSQIVVGLAGASSSGKTTLANKLMEMWGGRAVMLSYDEYYISRSKRKNTSVDEESPDVYDNEAFIKDLQRLKSNQGIEVHSNSRETASQGVYSRIVKPKPIILIEGYLIYNDPRARKLFDLKFFVDIPEEEMIKRRKQRRDSINPSRFDSDEYLSTKLIPGYRKYVLPQRLWADIVLDALKPTDFLALQVNDFLNWEIKEHPGYLGGKKNQIMQGWDQKYGKGNWRLKYWQTSDKRMLEFDEVFQIYIAGYEKYFREHPLEAQDLVRNYAYGYDKDMINKRQAFDPHALYDKPGVRNQFHNVAFNIAIENVTGIKFQGKDPIQVRGAGPGIPEDQQPAGWKWEPGRIPAVDPNIIPNIKLSGDQWWANGSVEDFYQRAKVLEIKTRDLNYLFTKK